MLKERLRTSSSKTRGEESPLFNARRELRSMVQEFFDKAESKIISELVSQLDVPADIKRLLSKEIRAELTPRKDIDYRDGRDGERGPRGPIGMNGRDGKDGRTGKDGSPDTPDQVVDKANRSKKKIKQSVIENLSEDMDSLKKAISQKRSGGGGGGGMGNVTHEVKSVSSATTTVSTNSKIGGLGYALWVYYNGQHLARGTHYTVGNDQKTLTLLFTPQDSTNIVIVYIRT